MSFAWPAALTALIALPFLIRWYVGAQHRRTRLAAAFTTEPLRPSVAPHGPRWRRHAPMAVLLVALAALIAAAARPQRSVAVPVTDGAVILADDVSSSMAATDVAPSRIGAAARAANRFLDSVPTSIRVGLLVFNQTPRLLQSPTSDRALTRSALEGLMAQGHTAIGDAINRSLTVLRSLRAANGKRPPGAIVLLSDGTSTNGADPLTAARSAAALHIPIYTVAVGTGRGTIRIWRGGRMVPVPVPLDGSELAQIATLSRGKAFTAGDAGSLTAVYTHLAAQLGHKHVNHEITASFAGAGLVLLLFGSAMSLRWFGRLI